MVAQWFALLLLVRSQTLSVENLNILQKFPLQVRWTREFKLYIGRIVSACLSVFVLWRTGDVSWVFRCPLHPPVSLKRIKWVEKMSELIKHGAPVPLTRKEDDISHHL